MLCSNCGKNEANVRYTRIVNGEKTELVLCDSCAKKMGIDDIDFNMPINFANFLTDFFEEDSMLPSFVNLENARCPKCGLLYDEFVKTGKFGCAECYNAFESKLDSMLKNLHGTYKHVGKLPPKITKRADVNRSSETPVNKKNNKELEELNRKLKNAIKEELYEDAAKYRDEIKKLQEGSDE